MYLLTYLLTYELSKSQFGLHSGDKLDRDHTSLKLNSSEMIKRVQSLSVRV